MEIIKCLKQYFRITDRQSFIRLEFLSAVKLLKQKTIVLRSLFTVDLNAN